MQNISSDPPFPIVLRWPPLESGFFRIVTPPLQKKIPPAPPPPIFFVKNE